MSMDTDFIGKCVDMASNVSKLAANVTAPKANAPKPAEKTEDSNMNQPHNQTVEVKVGNPEENRKPVILKEKTETHIHKVFPDNRELNEKECEIERREREEYARKERERRRESDKKFFRRMGIGIGIGATALVGFAVYDYYTHSRNSQRYKLSSGQPGGEPVTAEGTVQ